MVDPNTMLGLREKMTDGEVCDVLFQHADSIEYDLPLLMFKTKNGIVQLKHFLAVYYEPALTKVEL